MPTDAVRTDSMAWTRAPLSDLEVRQFDIFLREADLYGTLIVPLLVLACWTLWPHVAHVWIVLFAVSLLIEAGLKFWSVSVWTSQPLGHFRTPFWRVIIILGTLWPGLVFGGAALTLFLPLPPDDRFLLATIYAVMVFISVLAPPHYLPGTLCMSIPLSMIVPLTLLVVGGASWRTVALVQIAAVVFALTVTVRNNRRLTALIRLDMENVKLVDGLSEEKRLAERERARAEQAVVEKSRFIAAASHDLRQPLHALGLFQHALSRECDTEESQRLVDSLGRSTEQLNGLLDSLLDLSRLDANVLQPDRQRVELTRLLATLDDTFRQQALDKGLELHIPSQAPAVHSDPVLLLRVLGNLLSNAIRFSAHGTVSLQIDSPTAPETQVIVRVCDEGPGIPAGERDRVFDAFYRGSQRSADVGVGLGLSIVARLCTLLDIDLVLDAPHGGGARFSLTLPLAPAATLPDAQASPDLPWCEAHDGLPGLNVLLIDDDPDILDGMHRLLTRAGCHVQAVGSEAHAMRTLADPVPDIVLCDFTLQDGSSGDAVIARIRHAVGHDAPAIIITGESSPQALAQLESAGLDVMLKPVRPDDLAPAIAALTRSSS